MSTVKLVVVKTYDEKQVELMESYFETAPIIKPDYIKPDFSCVGIDKTKFKLKKTETDDVVTYIDYFSQMI